MGGTEHRPTEQSIPLNGGVLLRGTQISPVAGAERRPTDNRELILNDNYFVAAHPASK